MTKYIFRRKEVVEILRHFLEIFKKLHRILFHFMNRQCLTQTILEENIPPEAQKLLSFSDIKF